MLKQPLSLYSGPSEILAISTPTWTTYWTQYPGVFKAIIETKVVTMYEEYQVYDFNGFVGSVGGSLGLFIGFSFLDMILYLINKAQDVCRRFK